MKKERGETVEIKTDDIVLQDAATNQVQGAEDFSGGQVNQEAPDLMPGIEADKSQPDIPQLQTS